MTLKQLTKRGTIGPVLDHIHAVKGPISQFYQAIQNGLAVSYHLYQKTGHSLQKDHSLSHAFKQIESLAAHIPSLYQSQQPLLKLSKPADSNTLDARAAKRRLGHFFRM